MLIASTQSFLSIHILEDFMAENIDVCPVVLRLKVQGRELRKLDSRNNLVDPAPFSSQMCMRRIRSARRSFRD